MKHILSILSITALSLSGLNAQNISIPDTNLKSALLEIGIDTNQDNEISITEAQTVTNLSLTGRKIQNLSGLENFTNLELLDLSDNAISQINLSYNKNLLSLNLRNNQISSIEVSSQIKIEELYLDNNQLSSIDVSKNSSLQDLTLSGNKLSSLDISRNLALNSLEINNNLLPSIDVSKNEYLNHLEIAYNRLSTIDVSSNSYLLHLVVTGNNFSQIDLTNNVVLKSLYISENKFSQIDLQHNLALEYLEASNNTLSNLDLRDNTDISYLYLSNNQIKDYLDLSRHEYLMELGTTGNSTLKTICVLDSNKANVLTSEGDYKKDLQAIYGNNGCVPSIINRTSDEITLSPVPVSDVLTVSLPQDKNLKAIKVYNMEGRLVLVENSGKNTLGFAQFPTAEYIIQIELTNGQVVTKKVIKK